MYVCVCAPLCLSACVCIYVRVREGEYSVLSADKVFVCVRAYLCLCACVCICVRVRELGIFHLEC